MFPKRSKKMEGEVKVPQKYGSNNEVIDEDIAPGRVTVDGP